MATDKYEKIAKRLRATGIFALGGCIAVYVFLFFGQPLGGTNEWGAFGDFVSGVAGSIIALATLIAIAYTLSLQSTELGATKNLLEKQGRTLEEQTTTLHRQALETTFFRMLELFDKTSDALRDIGHDGRALNEMEQALNRLPPNRPREFNDFVEAYREVYRNYHQELAPYFRAFYHVIKLIDTADLSDEQKARYTSIARARLSGTHLWLHFINAGFGDEGRQGMKRLIERYGLLKHTRNLPFPAFLQAAKDSTFNACAFLARDERLATKANPATVKPVN